MIKWIIENWSTVLLLFYIIEKIVKITPLKWDDILIDGIKEIAGFIKKDRNEIMIKHINVNR